MTTTPATTRVRQLEAAGVSELVARLERDFGRRTLDDGILANQVLLAALDRGERDRCVVWPGDDPAAVLYTSPSGTLVPAGSAAAGPAFAAATEHSGWRVLVGDAPIADAILEAYPRGLLRRRPSARRQRLMIVGGELVLRPPPEGYRPAVARDVDVLTELACRLHVEDRMGPPIARSNRPAVRARMADSVVRGLTFVVERDGVAVAKLDLSLRSRRRGAQIAGVYVMPAYRGQGIAAGAVAALAGNLMIDGLPGVTLHVRADNPAAITAYRRAGFRDRGAWTLALR